MIIPDRCIKGISQNSELRFPDKPLSLQNVGAAAFTFRENINRSGTLWESSINWEDDSEVINFTLSQKKRNKIHFKFGVVMLNKSDIDEINRKPTINNIISYERNPKPENKYHGNLLLDGLEGNRTRRIVEGNLAAEVKDFCLNPNV